MSITCTDLTGADLTNVNSSGTILTRVNFTYTKLKNAIIKQKDMLDANFSNVDVSETFVDLTSDNFPLILHDKNFETY